jgi:hypothetical protein
MRIIAKPLSLQSFWVICRLARTMSKLISACRSLYVEALLRRHHIDEYRDGGGVDGSAPFVTVTAAKRPKRGTAREALPLL